MASSSLRAGDFGAGRYTAATKSVLIVDDEPDSRRALEILLQLHGFEGRSAADGEEALQLLRKRSFDVILTDWMMPRMSGADLITHLRRERLAKPDTVIVLTAAAEAARAELPHGIAVIGKPCDFASLLSEIDRAAART